MTPVDPGTSITFRLKSYVFMGPEDRRLLAPPAGGDVAVRARIELEVRPCDWGPPVPSTNAVSATVK